METVVVDGAVVVRLAGELDLATTARVQPEAASALDAPEARDLVLDCRMLDFMDSSGVALIADLDARARAAGRTLAVAAGSGPARRLLDLTGMTDRVTLVDDPASVPRPDRPGGA